MAAYSSVRSCPRVASSRNSTCMTPPIEPDDLIVPDSRSKLRRRFLSPWNSVRVIRRVASNRRLDGFRGHSSAREENFWGTCSSFEELLHADVRTRGSISLFSRRDRKGDSNHLVPVSSDAPRLGLVFFPCPEFEFLSLIYPCSISWVQDFIKCSGFLAGQLTVCFL
jgi:hypothetical protein